MQPPFFIRGLGPAVKADKPMYTGHHMRFHMQTDDWLSPSLEDSPQYQRGILQKSLVSLEKNYPFIKCWKISFQFV